MPPEGGLCPLGLGSLILNKPTVTPALPLPAPGKVCSSWFQLSTSRRKGLPTR